MWHQKIKCGGSRKRVEFCIYSKLSCYLLKIDCYIHYDVLCKPQDKLKTKNNKGYTQHKEKGIKVLLLLSCSVMSNSLGPHGLQHARLPCPSPSSRACRLSQWCHPTISSSVIPFSSCLKSFLASGSFQMSQLFISGDQSIRVSDSASVLPMNIQDWSPLGWTGWTFLQSKRLSRVFSNTTLQNYQFFGVQLSL